MPRDYDEDGGPIARDEIERQLSNIALSINALRADVREGVARVQTLELRVDRHGREIRAIKDRIDLATDDVSSPAIVTGQHSLADIAAELEREKAQRRDSMLWWRRQRWTWIGSVSVGLLIAAISTVVTYLLTHR